MSVFWLEQRYVFPVVAETYEEAEEFGFRNRTRIASECGPVSTTRHRGSRLGGPRDREGWEDPADFYRAAQPGCICGRSRVRPDAPRSEEEKP